MPARKHVAASEPAAAVSTLNAHLGFWIRLLSNHVSGQFRQALETHGSSVTEWVALRLLFDREDTSPADLMAALGMTKGAVSKIVSRLEAKGLVARSGEGRGQTLRLTAAGRRRVPVLARLADVNDEACFGHLAARERDALMALLQQMALHHGLRGVPTE